MGFDTGDYPYAHRKEHIFLEKRETMVCCFFGHSHTPDSVRPLLKEQVEKLLSEYEDIHFYMGNHGNFDAMARRTMKELKTQYPHLSYNVVLAYLPGKKYEFEAEDAYADTLHPDGLEFVPRRFAISARNKWMVEQSDMVICYKIADGGGAAQFIRMAERKGKAIINLANM